MHLLRDITRTFRAAPVFTLAVLLALVLAGFNTLMVGLMALRLNDLLPGPFAQMTHFTEPHHRIHDLTFGFLYLPTVVGMLAQLRRPAANVAGQVMTLVPWVGLLLAALFSADFFRVMVANPSRSVAAVALIATLLHPAGRDFFQSFRLARLNRGMLALVVIAAVPLLGLAFTNIELQRTVPDDHAQVGHYGFMAGFAFTVIGTGLLASLRPDGWRLTAWITGLLPTLLGISSLLYPNATSSLDLAWALVTICWGGLFIAVAEVTNRSASPALLGALFGSGGVQSNDHRRVAGGREPAARTPGWLNVVGGIALALVLLFVVVPVTALTGLGGRHTPPGSGQHAPAGDVIDAQASPEGNENHGPPPGVPDH